jgi:hypothetical protein
LGDGDAAADQQVVMDELLPVGRMHVRLTSRINGERRGSGACRG